MKKPIMIGIALILILLFIVSCGVPQQDYDKVVSDLTATQAEVESSQSQLESLRSQVESSQSQLESLRSQVESSRSELSTKETGFESKGALAVTIVVAASDSLNRAAANYICDGLADQVEIQAAIDALPPGGGSIKFLEGIYNITDQINITTDNVSLLGCGAGTVFKVMADLGQHGQTGNMILIWSGHVEIAHITFDGNNKTCFAGVHYIQGAAYGSFHHNYVLNFTDTPRGYGGLDFSNAHSCIAVENVFRNNWVAITISGGIRAYDCIIANNIIETLTNVGIRGEYPWRCVIMGNILHLGGGWGIRIVGSYNDVGNTIVDNVIYSTSGRDTIGIYLERGRELGHNRNTIIMGNKIYHLKAGAYNRRSIGIEGNCEGSYVVGNIIGGLAIGSPGVKYAEQHTDLFVDILAISTNHIGSWVGTSAEQDITVGITQPDVPRNLTVTCTNNAYLSGDVVVNGVDAKGNSVSETFTIIPGGTAVGNQAFSAISKITIPATVDGAEASMVSIGIGPKLGLSNAIHSVYKVKKNNADWSPANWTVDMSYDTVDVSIGEPIAGGDDFTIWYKTNLNVIL